VSESVPGISVILRPPFQLQNLRIVERAFRLIKLTAMLLREGEMCLRKN
jgi:hypothetical protein